MTGQTSCFTLRLRRSRFSTRIGRRWCRTRGGSRSTTTVSATALPPTCFTFGRPFVRCSRLATVPVVPVVCVCVAKHPAFMGPPMHAFAQNGTQPALWSSTAGWVPCVGSQRHDVRPTRADRDVRAPRGDGDAHDRWVDVVLASQGVGAAFCSVLLWLRPAPSPVPWIGTFQTLGSQPSGDGAEQR